MDAILVKWFHPSPNGHTFCQMGILPAKWTTFFAKWTWLSIKRTRFVVKCAYFWDKWTQVLWNGQNNYQINTILVKWTWFPSNRCHSLVNGHGSCQMAAIHDKTDTILCKTDTDLCTTDTILVKWNRFCVKRTCFFVKWTSFLWNVHNSLENGHEPCQKDVFL